MCAASASPTSSTHGGGVGRADAETVAEGAAYVVLRHFGLDTSGYSFAYVARWAEDKAVLRRNLEAIRQVAGILISGIEGQFAEEGAGRRVAETPAA